MEGKRQGKEGEREGVWPLGGDNDVKKEGANIAWSERM